MGYTAAYQKIVAKVILERLTVATSSSIGSMGLVYLPTFTIKINKM